MEFTIEDIQQWANLLQVRKNLIYRFWSYISADSSMKRGFDSRYDLITDMI